MGPRAIGPEVGTVQPRQAEARPDPPDFVSALGREPEPALEVRPRLAQLAGLGQHDPEVLCGAGHDRGLPERRREVVGDLVVLGRALPVAAKLVEQAEVHVGPGQVLQLAELAVDLERFLEMRARLLGIAAAEGNLSEQVVRHTELIDELAPAEELQHGAGIRPRLRELPELEGSLARLRQATSFLQNGNRGIRNLERMPGNAHGLLAPAEPPQAIGDPPLDAEAQVGEGRGRAAAGFQPEQGLCVGLDPDVEVGQVEQACDPLTIGGDRLESGDGLRSTRLCVSWAAPESTHRRLPSVRTPTRRGSATRTRAGSSQRRGASAGSARPLGRRWGQSQPARERCSCRPRRDHRRRSGPHPRAARRSPFRHPLSVGTARSGAPWQMPG
jgi:hypothetical protein